MNGDNEIAALVRLLDDPDENIFDQIKEKLMEIGPECIPSLEKARFEDNYGDLFISRAEHLIHDIGFGTLKKVHEKWLKFPVKLIDGVTQLDQYFFPNITASFIQHEINEMIKDIQPYIHLNMTPIEKVKLINQVIYEIYKVKGDKKNYHDPKNSSFGHLVQHKRGNPLTISMLYIELARHMNIPIKGVNLPNHFIVGYLRDSSLMNTGTSYKREDILFYINPFSKGVILKHSDIDDFLKEIRLDYNEYYFIPCDHKDITKRMLTNLIYSYRKSENTQIKNDLKSILELYK
ncbi:MAG: transglutaminase-like domain-containing protein [Bacteroidota bacterium]|nr:transglutaminase-like domain-containing protein [Bacteroidota bacterium]